MYAIKELRARHHAILRDAAAGFKNVEIANRYGLAPITVSCILRSPLAQAELARLKAIAETSLVDNRPVAERVKERLEEAAVDAVETNLAIMRSSLTDVKVRARVASHFMDKVIFKQQESDEREVSYRDILRSVAGIEAALRNSTVVPVADAKVIDTKAS